MHRVDGFEAGAAKRGGGADDGEEAADAVGDCGCGAGEGVGLQGGEGGGAEVAEAVVGGEGRGAGGW